MERREQDPRNMEETPNPAVYPGVHNMYSGVHGDYEGVHDDYTGVNLDHSPTVAPGMRDFVEEDASPEEIEEDDYTRVTRMTFDETH